MGSSPPSRRADSQRYLKLLDFSVVRTRIQEALGGMHPGTEVVPADRALGRVCAEDVRSQRDIPPRPISAMDGYALESSQLEGVSPSNPRSFRAGSVVHPETANPPPRRDPKEAVRISTGAPVPEGCDVVVRLEDTRLVGDQVVINRRIERMKNISPKGEDVRAGEIVLREGRILTPADIAMLIAVGRKRITVCRVPRVAILSIGNELREFDAREGDPEGPTTINNYSNLIAGFLQELGVEVGRAGISMDDPDEIAEKVRDGLARSDMLITIAGSSVGARDYAPTGVLASSGSRMVFHGVKVVPIRPAGMAIVDGKPVVIVPGHAVSAALTFFTVLLPVLNLLSGLPFDARHAFVNAEAREELFNDRALDALFLVRLESKGDEGEYRCAPLRWGSNLISNLSSADGFVWLGAGERIKKAGKVKVELMMRAGLSTALQSG